jgi:predicted DNA-binding transcriptional regulator YafY
MIMDDTEDPSLLHVEEHQSLNISAFRLLYIYFLLCQSEKLSTADLNTHLLNHAAIQRTFTKETLNKYLHTLQLFGCTILRFEEQGHTMYRLEDHPFKLECTSEDIMALRSVAGLLVQQPISALYKRFCHLSQRLCKMQQYQDAETALKPELSLLPEHSQQLLAQIDQFQKYCFEAQVLEICYETPQQVPKMMLVEPHELINHKKRIYLVGNDPKTNQKVRYELSRIQTHGQLPSRVRSQIVKTTVVFRLSGRAAMNYRPYPGENIVQKEDLLQVTHEADEVELLLRRLLKYGSHCQVVSPGWVREEMLNMIEHLIDSLEEPLENLWATLASTAQTDETLRKWACYFDNPQTSGDEAAD